MLLKLILIKRFEQAAKIIFFSAGDALHPPLGRSDHNVIHLLPKYRQMLKRTDPLIGLKIHLKNSETIL